MCVRVFLVCVKNCLTLPFIIIIFPLLFLSLCCFYPSIYQYQSREWHKKIQKRQLSHDYQFLLERIVVKVPPSFFSWMNVCKCESCLWVWIKTKTHSCLALLENWRAECTQCEKMANSLLLQFSYVCILVSKFDYGESFIHLVYILFVCKYLY